MRLPSVRATRDERARALPGDELIPGAAGAFTHAISIKAAPEDVWPWLAQMGAGSRAGWYSYDFIDNGRRPSANRVIAELQAIEPGTLFPAMPGIVDAREKVPPVIPATESSPKLRATQVVIAAAGA